MLALEGEFLELVIRFICVHFVARTSLKVLLLLEVTVTNPGQSTRFSTTNTALLEVKDAKGAR